MSSIKEIARLSGVSAATVSRVLNDPNHRCSSEEVRERIWRVAREQGYLPNEAARSLRRGTGANQGKTSYIDVLFTQVGASQSNPFYSELYRYVENEIRAQFGIVAHAWREAAFSDERRCRRVGVERLIEALPAGGEAAGRSEGLVILGACSAEAIGAFMRRYKAVACIDFSPDELACDEVACSATSIALRAVDHLFSLGHRRIGYAGRTAGEHLFEGYRAALGRHGLVLDPDIVFACEHTERAGLEVMDRLLGLDERPSAIFCADDLVAVGMIQQLARDRVQSQRFSLVGVGNIEEGQLVRPMLTSVAVPKAEMARAAVIMLMGRLSGGHAIPIGVNFGCRLVERESCFALSGPDSIEYII